MGTNYFLISQTDKNKQDRLNEIKSQLSDLANQTKDLVNKELTDSLQCSIDSLSITETIHIGKLSYGWRFVFQGKNFLGLDDFEKCMSHQYSSYMIMDEYERPVKLEDLLTLIRDSRKNVKKNQDDYKDWSIDDFPLLFCDFS